MVWDKKSPSSHMRAWESASCRLARRGGDRSVMAPGAMEVVIELQNDLCFSLHGDREGDPMPARNTSDPRHWRDRAAQMRALAFMMKDDEVVTLMTDLAADYDELAERAAARRTNESTPKPFRGSSRTRPS